MKHAYMTLVKYRFYTFLLLTFLIIAELTQPLIGLVSFEFELIFVWLSLFTLLAWMVNAVFIGIVSPIDNRTLNCAYFALAGFPLAIFVNLGLFAAGQQLDIFWAAGVPLIIWIGTAGLVGATAGIVQNKKAHLTFVVFPLIMTSWTGLVMFSSLAVPDFASSSNLYGLARPLLVLVLSAVATIMILTAFARRRVSPAKSRTVSAYILIFLKALTVSAISFFILVVLSIALILLVPYILTYLAAIIVAAAGTAFVYTIKGSIRRIVTIAVIGLWAMVVVLGAYWAWTVDNGFDAFSGEERVAAELWAKKAGGVMLCTFGPVGLRVTKNESGHFQGNKYTFWRLPGNPCR